MAKRKKILPAAETMPAGTGAPGDEVPTAAAGEERSPESAAVGSTDGAGEVAHIAEGLRGLAVDVDSLILDPANARKHPEKNLEATMASLRVYGQRKPVVVNRRNMTVEAGNGTLSVARTLGWKKIA